MAAADDAVQTQANQGEAPTGGGRVTELRVSAHLMTLETGVYCIFPAPGSRPPEAMTGLPGVRITRCPGLAGRPEAVSISTFREDGWLDNTAALVRVSDGPAQVLVTIYQAGGQPPENAPRLQVLRLSSDPSAAAAQMPEPAPDPELMAHIQKSGDVPGRFGEWIGVRGSRNWIEGFSLSDKGPIAPGEVEYQGVLGKGWQSPWVSNGTFCGSRGMALPLLGLNLRLSGDAAKHHTLRYWATFVDGSEVGPIEEGSPCESPGLAALESFRVELVPRSSKTPGTAAPRAAPPKTSGAKTPPRTGRR